MRLCVMRDIFGVPTLQAGGVTFCAVYFHAIVLYLIFAQSALQCCSLLVFASRWYPHAAPSKVQEISRLIFRI